MRILFILLLLYPLINFSQSREDLTNEIIRLQKNIDFLKLDTIKLKIEIETIKRKNITNLNKQKFTIDSLNWACRKITKERDSLISFKNEIYSLSRNTVILYQMRNKEELYYINLSSYKLIKKEDDDILLIPILDKSKWEKPKINGYPQPDNLSLHLYPHIQGNTIKN